MDKYAREDKISILHHLLLVTSMILNGYPTGMNHITGYKSGREEISCVMFMEIQNHHGQMGVMMNHFENTLFVLHRFLLIVLLDIIVRITQR